MEVAFLSDSYRVAILGATGAVGTELIELLASRNFPIAELKLFASPKSAGTKLKFRAVQKSKDFDLIINPKYLQCTII